jgi:hypothetical protein
VQWQDISDRRVACRERWQGMADEQGRVRWWVSSTEFGLGPFRWVIYYEKPSGATLTMSRPFDLPQVTRQRVVVEVTLQP